MRSATIRTDIPIRINIQFLSVLYSPIILFSFWAEKNRCRGQESHLPREPSVQANISRRELRYSSTGLLSPYPIHHHVLISPWSPLQLSDNRQIKTANCQVNTCLRGGGIANARLPRQCKELIEKLAE